MYIEFYKVNSYEYARLRKSVRKNGVVTHGKGQTLGRVLDKERLIFQNRQFGLYQYDLATGERRSAPADFCAKVERKNSREQLIVDFGNVYFIQKFIEKHGLWPLLESVGYGNPDSFKSLLSYYILENQSNAHAEDWYEGSYARIAYPRANLSSPRISDQLKEIGREDVCRRFFKAYIEYLKVNTTEAAKGLVRK